MTPNPMCMVPTSELRWADSLLSPVSSCSDSNRVSNAVAGIADGPWKAVVAPKDQHHQDNTKAHLGSPLCKARAAAQVVSK